MRPPPLFVTLISNCYVRRTNERLHTSNVFDPYNPIMPPTLTDLPSEVILEQILPLLSLKDILYLSQVNHQLHTLTVRLLSQAWFLCAHSYP